MSTWHWRSYSCRTLNSPWQSCGGVHSRGRWARQRHSHGSISDLGRGGCYIGAMSSFGVNSEVEIRIVDQNRTFVAQAKVVFAAAGMGMGVMFTVIDPEQSPVLDGWLAELSGEVQPEPLATEQ